MCAITSYLHCTNISTITCRAENGRKRDLIEMLISIFWYLKHLLRHRVYPVICITSFLHLLNFHNYLNACFIPWLDTEWTENIFSNEFLTDPDRGESAATAQLSFAFDALYFPFNFWHSSCPSFYHTQHPSWFLDGLHHRQSRNRRADVQMMLALRLLL